ncbi:MAG TPA: tRNA preQ1(34) S-adenosylmethionine ribosyltransferase-isomerase QueA [Acidimicrobiia bacterium]|nr:tRNA preQ1(34) S-adenosylmethionine ribosyltransferase-isomerase QueA [Acidimicrobiia bacterium]
MRVEEFIYPLPEAAIAQVAIEPRHDARLLDTRDMSDHVFLDLPTLLGAGDLVVVNETKVRAARLVGRRVGTGGEIELLLLTARPDGSWEALARPSRRLRAGVEIEFDGLGATVVEGPRDGLVVVDLQAPDVEAAIEAAGRVPLPPYFKGALDDSSRYQTMFARRTGSAAAPTAGLHFTAEVVGRLEATGVEIAPVDLHVGIDTFRPIAAEEVEDHRMHSEWCSIPGATAEAIDRARVAGGRVVAAGTTVTRALETFGNEDGTVEAGSGETTLFLKPGDRFRVVDALITNFHVPGSTLVVLVAAFMGTRWREAYETALDRGYRFLSFGDAMYAERGDA